MREIRSLGSVRGVPGNRHSYRDTWTKPRKVVYPVKGRDDYGATTSH